MPDKPREGNKTIGFYELLDRTDTEEIQTTPLRGHPDLTLRDEANAIYVHAVRNGFLEDLHAGSWTPVLSDPSFSRITDEEMKKLNIEASARITHWLYMRELLLDERPDEYFQLVTMVGSPASTTFPRPSKVLDNVLINVQESHTCFA